MLDLQPIKDRLSDATPGPWAPIETHRQSPPDSFFSVAVVGRWEVRASIPSQARPEECDADLIANAPHDLAALVAEVERLENEAAVMQQVTLAGLAAEIERLRAQLAEDGLRMVELEAKLGSVRLDRNRAVKAFKKMEAAAADGVGAILENRRLKQVLEASPVILRKATFKGRTLHLNWELRLPVTVGHDLESGTVYLQIETDEELSINVYAETREALVAELVEQIHCIYNEYVCADPETLTESAQQMRLRWCALLYDHNLEKNLRADLQMVEAFLNELTPDEVIVRNSWEGRKLRVQEELDRLLRRKSS